MRSSPMLAVAAVVSAPAIFGGAAFGAPASDEAERAVALARNSFEYRDFQKVIEALEPWVHPPRIADSTLMIEARRLMGISLHVLDRPSDAREEFAQLLLLDPAHRLDPFVVPPPVIETFEEVRRQMEPALEGRIPAANAETNQEASSATTSRVVVQLVELPHPLVVFAPFGIPQFALDQNAWGTVWALAQVSGLALNAVAHLAGKGMQGTAPAARSWLALQYAGAATFAAGWGGSMLHGYVQLERRREALLPPALPEGSARALPAAPGIALTVPFP